MFLGVCITIGSPAPQDVLLDQEAGGVEDIGRGLCGRQDRGGRAGGGALGLEHLQGLRHYVRADVELRAYGIIMNKWMQINE